MIAKFAASFFMDDRHFGFIIKFLKRTLLLMSGPRDSGKELAKRRYEDQWQEGTYYAPQ
jgi:hypothetical protein